jgi:hypothetical protein
MRRSTFYIAQAVDDQGCQFSGSEDFLGSLLDVRRRTCGYDKQEAGVGNNTVDTFRVSLSQYSQKAFDYVFAES